MRKNKNLPIFGNLGRSTVYSYLKLEEQINTISFLSKSERLILISCPFVRSSDIVYYNVWSGVACE